MRAIAIAMSAIMLFAMFVACANVDVQNIPLPAIQPTIPGTRTTYIEGNIISDQNWNGSVVIAGNVTINNGVTVTVEPGTIVTFNASQYAAKAGVNYPYYWPNIFVYGTFITQGTSVAPITYLSDHIVPTDRTSSNFFDFIWFYSEATPPTFSYCKFQYGGGCIWSNVSLTVDHCTFNEFDAAIHIANYADLTISNTTFRTNDTESDAIITDSGGKFVLRDVTYVGTCSWLSLYKVNDVDIRRCSATTVQDYYSMFYMEECGSLNMTQTTLNSDEVEGLYQYNCRGVANIWDVTISNTYGDGLHVDTLEAVDIYDITWVNCDDLVYVSNSKNVEVTGLHWTGTCDDGVEFDDVGDAHIHNLTGSYSYYFVSIDDAENVVVADLDIDGVDASGAIYVSYPKTLWVHDCTITGSCYAVSQSDYYEEAEWVMLEDLDIDISDSYGTGISLDGAAITTIKDCVLNIEMSTGISASDTNELKYVGNTWGINCSRCFNFDTVGKIRLNSINTEFTEFFALFSECEDVVMWDLDLTGTGTSLDTGIYVEYASGFTLHNSSLIMEGGKGVNVTADYWGDYVPKYVNISDVTIETQSTESNDAALSVESEVSAVIKDVAIITKDACGLRIISDGKTVAQDISIESKSQNAPLISVDGEGDTILKNIEATGQYSPQFLFAKNDGTLDASALVFEGGETATGIRDEGTGVNTYSSITMTGNYSLGIQLESGGKKISDISINLTTDGIGVYCENVDMDVDLAKTIEITDITIYGGEEGIDVISNNSVIPFVTTIKNVFLYQMVYPAYFCKGTVTLEEVVIEDPPLSSGTGIEIDAADVKVSRSVINYYDTGITLDTVDSKLTCDYVDIADSSTAIDNVIGGTLTLKNMNIQDRDIRGIDSGSATTLTNVWFSRPASECYYGTPGVDLYYDFSAVVTPDYTTLAPIDIVGMDQCPYLWIACDNSQQDEALQYEYLGKTVNFTVWSGDPDVEHTITDAYCMLYASGTTDIKWEDIDLTGVANYITFTVSYDTSTFKDNSAVYFEAVVKFSDGGIDDRYRSYTTLQPAINDSKDGGTLGDAPDDKANARHLETDTKFDHGAINKPIDIDWYFIDAKNLKEFTVEVTESNKVVVEVYDPTGAKVGVYTNYNRTVKVLSPKDGAYTIKVSGNASSYYSIEILTVQKEKEKTMMDKIMDQGWFMMIMEALVGLLITGTLAIIGIILLSRKRRKVSRYMNLITKAYEDNRANPPKALEELTKLHNEIEELFKAGKFEENQYLILDKKVSDHITQLRIPETQQRVEAINKEKLPAPLDQQMKEVVADGVVTPEEAASVKEATEKTDIPPEKKEEVEGMVEGWKDADMNLPPPPPPVD